MNKQHAGVILGGVLMLVTVMGISRFAFTPILPFMRNDVGFSLATAGYLASSNYIGYFVGALGAGFITSRRKLFTLAMVIINVLSTLLMGLIDNYTLWLLLRFIAGVTGGFVFVLASSIVIDYLAQHNLAAWSGYLFGGIGLGIAFSGFFTPIFEAQFAWQGAWLGLGILSLIFMLATGFLWRHVEVPDVTKQGTTQHSVKLTSLFMLLFIIAYGLEGLGYIITGTFLVDIIHNIPSLRAYSSYAWVVVGLAAIPSAPVWSWAITKFSPIFVLVIAYALQVIGIVLPVFSQSVFGILLSAFLFGMTFVGIVTMTTSYARQLFPTQSALLVSLLTTVYAFGQIIGPIVASQLVDYYATYNAALLFAGAIVLLALLIIVISNTQFITKNIQTQLGNNNEKTT